MTPELLKSLSKPSTYPEPTGSVFLRQTHVSYLFLTDHFVYKVKKPVNFGFLNFTTLDRRRFYCHEEVRLNSRLAAELYLGVVELRDGPGGPFGGSGAIVDYAVKMHRLPEERMLSRLLEEDRVSPAEMEEIARVIGRFHLGALRAPEIDACGTPAALAKNWEDNLRQVERFVGVTIEGPDLTVLRHYAERFLDRDRELVEARVAGGFVRDCDGDIHSANICLADRVYVFDCIEFNDKFRFCDTAADISFLLMDLEFSGRKELCDPFLSAYREITEDAPEPRLVDFYRSYRAFVRGKVESLELNDPEVPDSQKAEAKEKAGRYFRLSRGYALRYALPPTMIVTCGLMGTGKSTVAAELCFQLGCELYRGDVVRKELFPKPADGVSYDGGIYSPACNEATYAELLRRAEGVLRCGKSVVVDSTFRRRSDRVRFAELAARVGARFHILEVVCDEEIIKERLLAREGDPREVSDGRWNIFPLQKAEYEAPSPGEAIAVDGALPAAAAADIALKGMGLLP